MEVNTGTVATLLFVCSVVTALGIRKSNTVTTSQYNSQDVRTSAVTISRLWIYPIKSCKGIEVSSATVTARGFELDRDFMLIDKKGKFVSQRTEPRLALVELRLVGNGVKCMLEVSAPGMTSTLTVPLNYNVETTPIINATVWGDACSVFEVGDGAGSDWFCTYLGRQDVRLVRMAKDSVRPTDPDYAPVGGGQTSLADGFPFLIISDASMEDVNRHLTNPVTIDRFRPNIMVTGCRAFEEDTWTSVEFNSPIDAVNLLTSQPKANTLPLPDVAVQLSHDINETRKARCQPIRMGVVKPCARCTMPNNDPTTGVMDPDRQPSKTMKLFRSGEKAGFVNPQWKKDIFFGQNLDHGSQFGPVISVGGTVRIAEEKSQFLNSN